MKQKDIKMTKQSTKKNTNKSTKAGADRDTSDDQPIDSELANIIEAALFASQAPLGIRKMMGLFPDDARPSKVDIQNVVLALQEQCEHRGIELRRIGNGWRFQSKEKYSPWLRKLRADKAPRYSRALLETLSIIAYRQPVTRGDIEEIRGVGVSSDTIRVLEERDWIAQIGHRDVPGRPALFGTTQGFLEYFNMTSLRELPELMEKRGMGEIAKDMNLTLPMDGLADAEERSEQNEEAASADVIELRPGQQETAATQNVSEPAASDQTDDETQADTDPNTQPDDE
jgi:segregation and condensation protein B